VQAEFRNEPVGSVYFPVRLGRGRTGRSSKYRFLGCLLSRTARAAAQGGHGARPRGDRPGRREPSRTGRSTLRTGGRNGKTPVSCARSGRAPRACSTNGMGRRLRRVDAGRSSNTWVDTAARRGRRTSAADRTTKIATPGIAAKSPARWKSSRLSASPTTRRCHGLHRPAVTGRRCSALRLLLPAYSWHHLRAGRASICAGCGRRGRVWVDRRLRRLGPPPTAAILPHSETRRADRSRRAPPARCRRDRRRFSCCASTAA